MLVSPAGRDDADDFLAIGYLPVDMDYEQNGSRPCAELRCPQRVPSLFTRFINAILANEAVLILQSECGEFE